MKVMVTGAGGMLAAAVAGHLARAGDTTFGLYVDEAERARCAGRFGGEAVAELGRSLDRADALDGFRAAARAFAPDWIFHLAAWTDVDGCEGDEARALRANGLACLEVGAVARELGARVIAVSTDYVFDGAGAAPWREDAPVGLRSAYGRSKLAGERYLALAGGAWTVVRTSWLFGAGGRNFVDTIADRLRREQPVQVVNDQRGCPTYAPDLALALRRLAEVDARGLVHVANAGETTWYEFAREIGRQLGREALVGPTTSGALARPAPRPAYSVLDTSRYTALAGAPLPSWRDALGRHLAAAPSAG